MREVVQVVQLNDFEINVALDLAPHIRKLGKGFRWKHDIAQGQALMFYIEEATQEKIVITGRFGAPKLRCMIKGNHVSFSTVGAIAPTALFYDLFHLLMGQCSHKTDIIKPPNDAYEQFSTDPHDYYLMNNEYTPRISEYFKRILAAGKDLTYMSGMFYIEIASAAHGNDKSKALVKQFADKSYYDEVAFALVYHRGRSLPLFYGNGAIFCLLTEKAYFDTILEDFTRIFMKFSIPEGRPIHHMGKEVWAEALKANSNRSQ